MAPEDTVIVVSEDEDAEKDLVGDLDEDVFGEEDSPGVGL